MGQTEKGKVEYQQQLQHTVDYPLDIRMLEYFVQLPTCLSYNTQKVIEEIDGILAKIQRHPLEQFLINSIDVRFSKLNRVNMESLKAGMSSNQILEVDQSQFQFKDWAELSSKQSFLKVLSSLQRQYEVEMLIQQEFIKQNNPKAAAGLIGFQTLRKPIYSQNLRQYMKLDQGLIMRLFYHFYMVMLKTYANSGQKHVFHFHQETGRQLCFMILHDKLNLQELFQLCYYMVYIDKHPHQLVSKLAIINQLYHAQCLQTFYTINVEHRRLQVARTSARLYLDELYMNSIRQAEDPEIKTSDDTLLPIRVFPISRVKDKPRP